MRCDPNHATTRIRNCCRCSGSEVSLPDSNQVCHLGRNGLTVGPAPDDMAMLKQGRFCRNRWDRLRVIARPISSGMSNFSTEPLGTPRFIRAWSTVFNCLQPQLPHPNLTRHQPMQQRLEQLLQHRALPTVQVNLAVDGMRISTMLCCSSMGGKWNQYRPAIWSHCRLACPDGAAQHSLDLLLRSRPVHGQVIQKLFASASINLQTRTDKMQKQSTVENRLATTATSDHDR